MIEIKAQDLQVEVFRDGSPQTKYNRVRITHTPTGTIAECDVHRSQLKNREVALEELKDRLWLKEIAEEGHLP